MRTALLVASLALASAAVSQQIPVPPFGSTFTSTLTRGFWFQAPINFLISGISVPNEALQPFQVVEVIDLGTTPPPAYPTTVAGTQLFYSNNTPGASLIPTAIPCVQGNYYGILGACTPAVGSTTSYNSYGTPAGTFASSILGLPTTLTRFGTQFGIGAGGNQQCWSEAAGSIARVDVYATPMSGGTIATNSTLGAGCGAVNGSFFESFASTAAFDLSNTTLTWLNTGSGYTVVSGLPTTFVTPSASAINIAPGLLDGEQAVGLSAAMPVLGGTTNTLQVCTKGYVATAPGNGIDFTPTGAELLNFSQTTWACWHDYNQTVSGSGLILFEEVAGIAYVTWNGVISYLQSTSPSTFQFQFEVATGNVTLVIGTFGNVSVDPVVVGFSPGGVSPASTSIDISASPPIVLNAPESTGLSLSASTRPVTGTNWNLNVSSVPAAGLLGVDLFGAADPGVPDLSLLGLGKPGCQLRSTLDGLLVYISTGTTHSYSFAIPNDPSLAGFHLFTQSAVLDATNLANTITTNGIDGMVGTL